MSNMNNTTTELTFRISDGNNITVDDIINTIDTQRQGISEQLQRMMISGFELSSITFSFEPKEPTMHDLKIPPDRIDNILKKDRERINEIIDQLTNPITIHPLVTDPPSTSSCDMDRKNLKELHERLKFYCRHLEIQMNQMTYYSGPQVDQFVRDWANHLVNRSMIDATNQRAIAKNLMGLGFQHEFDCGRLILQKPVETMYNRCIRQLFVDDKCKLTHIDVNWYMDECIIEFNQLTWVIQYWCEMIDQVVYQQNIYVIKRLSEIPHMPWLWHTYDKSNISPAVPLTLVEDLDTILSAVAVLVNSNKRIDIVIELHRDENGVITGVDLIRGNDKDKFCDACVNVYNHYKACGAKFSGCTMDLQKQIDFLLNYDLVGPNVVAGQYRNAEDKLKALSVIPI